MREAEAKAREAAAQESREARPSEPAKKDPNEKELEVDFDVKNTGQTKAINGFDTRQVVATITVREKGKKIQESGGIVMTVDTWLSKSAPSTERGHRFRPPLLGEACRPDVRPSTRSRWRPSMAMFPGVKEAFARFEQGRPRRHRHSDDDDDGCR